jgi:hypothetical protein
MNERLSQKYRSNLQHDLFLEKNNFQAENDQPENLPDLSDFDERILLILKMLIEAQYSTKEKITDQIDNVAKKISLSVIQSLKNIGFDYRKIRDDRYWYRNINKYFN